MTTDERAETAWEGLGGVVLDITEELRCGHGRGRAETIRLAPPAPDSLRGFGGNEYAGHPTASAAAPCLPCPLSGDQGELLGAGDTKERRRGPHDTDPARVTAGRGHTQGGKSAGFSDFCGGGHSDRSPREIQTRELAKVSRCSLIVCATCVGRSEELAKVNPAPINLDLSQPLSAVLVVAGSLEPRRVVLRPTSICEILRTCSEPKIASAIVEAIPIYMVSFETRRRLDEEVVQKHSAPAYVSARINDAVVIGARRPSSLRDKWNIRFIDNCDEACANRDLDDA